MDMRKRITVVALGALLTLLVAACGGDSGGETPGDDPNADTGGGSLQLSAEVASYEIVAGESSRFLLGLFTPNGLVSCGQVPLSFSYLGTEAAPEEAVPDPGMDTPAHFVLVPQEGGPLPSSEDLDAAAAKEPEITAPDQVRGVYQATDLIFDQAGFWEVSVDVTLGDGSTGAATASFAVVKKAAYPNIGEQAPNTKNWTINDVPKDISAEGLDSRAAGGAEIPDPTMHDTVIAETLGEGKPQVIVVATPLYCQSRFCGPVVDEVGALQERYGDRANFVHLEVWRDFNKRQVNKAAADWVYRKPDLTEPWVFLVGADGTIIDRWANVVDPRELAQELEQLPARGGSA